MRKDYDAMAKVAVIGDSAVGKTNLLLRYVSADYSPTHIATIGIDFKIKTVEINGFKIKMQIWDTAGQERFRNLTGTIYQGAGAVLLTYAINNRKSFDNVTTWLQDVRNFANQNVIITIAATKCDLQQQRSVDRSEGEALAASIKANFFQTSSKNNLNVQQVFQSIAEKMYKRLITGESNSNIKKNQGGDWRESAKEEHSTIGIKANHKEVLPQPQPQKSKLKLSNNSVNGQPNKRKKCC